MESESDFDDIILDEDETNYLMGIYLPLIKYFFR